MFRKIYVLSLAISVLFGNFLKPPNNSDFSYTHILFEWDQLVNIVLLNQFESLADINSDDLVNILDIVQLVNIILL